MNDQKNFIEIILKKLNLYFRLSKFYELNWQKKLIIVNK
jgi:hypothetical protein